MVDTKTTTEERLRDALEHAVFLLEGVRNGDIHPRACSFQDFLAQAKSILESADPVTIQEKVINNHGSPT